MQITASSAYYGLDEGYMPITQLPTVAQSPLTMSGHPIYKPDFSYQGTANNEAETTTFSNVARQQFGVDGTGVTVGVLSDSVNQFNGGLADSTSTGNLPTNPGVNVLQDGPAGSTDEGRAMLENIYDIAPGAGLAFATAGGGDLALRQQHQGPGQHRQGQHHRRRRRLSRRAVLPGRHHLPGHQHGHRPGRHLLQRGRQRRQPRLPFDLPRPRTARWRSLGTGTFMNFDGTGATQTLQLPITVNVANTPIIFQFDQPFNTQQPAGSTNVVTSQVNFYVLEADGHDRGLGHQRQHRDPGAAPVRDRPDSRQLHGGDPGRHGPEPRPRRVRRSSASSPTTT